MRLAISKYLHHLALCFSSRHLPRPWLWLSTSLHLRLVENSSIFSQPLKPPCLFCPVDLQAIMASTHPPYSATNSNRAESRTQRPCELEIESQSQCFASVGLVDMFSKIKSFLILFAPRRSL